MGIFKKAASKIFGAAKPAGARLFKTAQELQKEKEEREREEQQSYLETTQQRGRDIVQEHRGRFYRNVKPMGRGEAPGWQDFLYGEAYSRFSSSNVLVLQYDITASQLYVKYKNNRWYRYDGVTKQEAQAFWAAASKGVMAWTILRQRGSATAHKKSFTKDSQPPAYLPLDRRYSLEAYGSSDVLRRASRRT